MTLTQTITRDLRHQSVAHTNAFHNGQASVINWFRNKRGITLHQHLFKEARNLFPWDYLKEFRNSFFAGAETEIMDMIS